MSLETGTTPRHPDTKEDCVNPDPLDTDDSARDAVMDRIVGVLVKILKVRPDQIRLESRLTMDLRADSLDLAEIAVELEEAFQVKVSEADVHRIATVGEAIDYVRSLRPTP
jgi:acyl carrier protein